MLNSISQFRNKLVSNKKLVENFSFTALLQSYQLIISFIIYPYLIRVLGTETYGLIAFAQTIIFYFVIIINFGFRTIITAEIAVSSSNNSLMSKIASATYGAKLVLTLLSFIILLILMVFIEEISSYSTLYFLSFLLIIGELLLPNWFFQGIEKMKVLTYINIIVKTLFLILIFLFVKDKEDYLFVPFFLGLGSILSGLAGTFMMYNTKINGGFLHFIFPKLVHIFWAIKRSYSYFLANLAATIKGKSSNIFIGAFLSYESVAIYDICFKIVNIILNVYSVFGTVLFPRVAKTKDVKLIFRLIKFLFLVGLLIFLIVFVFAKPIWGIIGGESFINAGVTILRIMSISFPVSALVLVLGSFTLIGFNFDKFFTYSLYLTLIFYFIAIGVLVALNIFTLINVSIVYVLCILFELVSHFYFVKKLKIF